MELQQVVIPFAVALGVSALATPVISRLAIALGVIDRPGSSERKVSRRANMPLLGGLAVACGCVAGLLSALAIGGDALVPDDNFKALLIGGALLLFVGAADDRFDLGAGRKLPFQIAAAAVAYHYGLRVDYVTGPLIGNEPVDLPIWLAWTLTTLWIVGVTNAMNLMDGLDGVTAGMGAIIGLTLAIICYQAGQAPGVILGAALVGALIGFLPFNFPPARIFLGDTGALFIGFSLALLALENYRKASLLTFVVPVLALAVPLLDTALSVLRRIRSGQNIFAGDSMHMHHRLLRSEGSQRRAVLWLYFLTACFCIIAVSFTQLEGIGAVLLLIAVVVLTIRLLRNLGVFSIETEPPLHIDSANGAEADALAASGSAAAEATAPQPAGTAMASGTERGEGEEG